MSARHPKLKDILILHVHHSHFHWSNLILIILNAVTIYHVKGQAKHMISMKMADEDYVNLREIDSQSMQPRSQWQALHCSACSFGATMWVCGQYIEVGAKPYSPL